ncbi:general odorant-binding protein 56h [Drosophila biarmipes]|uniref:general odorant-binding protein 56h n=1 Tax=Drosophila biarmipes TaxID=125945 RepID=UPI0007E815C7|nr:general odorant-binding protein 56h [Drosophila biarmipes]
MKVLATLAILMTLGPLTSAVFQHIANQCAKRDGITPEFLANNPHSSRVKCYYACMLEKLDLVANGVTGIYNLSVLNITPENYDKYGIVVQSCLTIIEPRNNKCEQGFRVFECLKRHVDGLP